MATENNEHTQAEQVTWARLASLCQLAFIFFTK